MCQQQHQQHQRCRKTTLLSHQQLYHMFIHTSFKGYATSTLHVWRLQFGPHSYPQGRCHNSHLPPPKLSKKPCGSWYVALDLLRDGDTPGSSCLGKQLLRHGLYSATKQAIMTFENRALSRCVSGWMKMFKRTSWKNPTGMNQIKEMEIQEWYIYMYILNIYIYSINKSMSEKNIFFGLDGNHWHPFQGISLYKVYIEYHEEWPFDGIRLHVTSMQRKQTRVPSLWL